MMHLNPQNLQSRREPLYFTLLAIVATLIWGLIIVSLVGILYALIFAVSIWFANGLMVARLRANSVEASPTQFPDLFRAFSEVAAKLDVKKLPRLFVLQADGAVNAFATRHSGRDFVVVFSSLYESLGAGSDEMKYLLGHELGHVHRKHINKFMFLLTASWIPLLGVAYRRSVEETCDRYGTFASGNVQASARAMTILSAGKDPGREANIQEFADQYVKERGFFVSWNEVISLYPTLCQRVHHILSSSERPYPEKASRNPLAYLFGLCFSGFTIAFIVMAIYLVIVIRVIGAQVDKHRVAQQQRQAQQQEVDEEFEGAPEDQGESATE